MIVKLKKKTFIINQIENHPVRTSLILIILLWIPYIIISYPGLATGDTYDEISQYFHLDSSWSIESINLLSEDVYINKHHSVLHTVVMGFVYNVGKSLSSFTFGAFLYTVLQVILLIWIFVFMFKYMKKIKVSNSLILFSF